MKRILLSIVILFMFNMIYAQTYKKIRVYLNDIKDTRLLASKGIAVEDGYFDRKTKTISLFVSDKEFTEIQNLNLRTEVLIENWKEYYQSRQKLSPLEKRQAKTISKNMYGVSGFGYGSMGGYFTLDEMYNRLDSMYLLYPSIITQKFQIGTSVLGRPIYGLKISDNPAVDENEPEILFTALTHAREPEGMMTVMYFMYYLLENYGTDPEVTYLVNNREFYFIPAINVDGYEYNHSTNPDGGGFWRKNRQSPYGVDLNRNYGYEWGYDNIGSSPDQGNETYRGTSGFSEPETQAVRDFCNAHHFSAALNYHSYSNDLIYPWGYIDTPTPDSSIFSEFSMAMTKYNHYVIGTGSGTVGYITNGDSDDWMYGEQTTKDKIIAMTPEVGNDNDGFWPDQNRIFPIAQENVYPNLYLAWTIGGYVGIQNVTYNKKYFVPGEDVNISVGLKNYGLATCNNVQIELTSLSNDLKVNTPAIILNSIQGRKSENSITPFNISISNTATVQQNVSLVFNISTDGVPMSKDTINFIIGVPKEIFADTTNNISDTWTSTGWDNITSDFYSAPNCYTDSKNGVYSNNADIIMTSKDQIDLTGYKNPMLTFQTKYKIEADWDYGQVKISTDNGTTWNALQGKYSNPGTGSFQPNAQPVYDGFQNNWVKEEISLAEYSGSKIKLRFELKSDEYQQYDGWYIDDIAIIYYPNLPVELISFTAVPGNGSVKLKWSTASEINNKGFLIQKSNDKINWKNITFITGYGTSLQLNKYIYYDNNPFNGKSYYKLIQNDFNGTSKVISTIEVNANGLYKYSLSQNFPNPFNPKTEVTYSLATAGFVSLKIYDILGNEAAAIIQEVQEPGKYTKEISADRFGLSSGIYFYTLKVNDFIQTRKMIILK